MERDTLLSPPDRDLVRRDPGLPGLALLLDPEAFASVVRTHAAQGDLSSAALSYVRYKPTVSCLAGYELTVAGTPVHVYAKAYRLAAGGKLHKLRSQPAIPGLLGAGHILIEAQGIAVSVFPNDRRLDGLIRLADDAARPRLLRKLFPSRRGLWHGTLRTLRYNPERRYVARLRTDEGAGAVLKVYGASGFAHARDSTKALKSSTHLILPRRIGRSTRHQMLAFEWLSGRLLSEAIADVDLADLPVSVVGAAIADLHRQHPAALPSVSRQEEALALGSLASALGMLCPHLAGRARAIARRLGAELTELPPVDGAIHGDFYAKQVLLTDGGVAVLDLDEARRGDPAGDLGTFIAHLERDALRGTLPPERVEPVARALLEGYEDAGGRGNLDRINLYTATALFRLAPHPFRQREPDWPERIAAILGRAEAILAATPSGASAQIHVDVPVLDPLGAAGDARMPFLACALDPDEVQRELLSLAQEIEGVEDLRLLAIRVARHKPGRRYLIEYDVEVRRSTSPEAITLVGKARAKGLDRSTFDLQRSLQHAGFTDRSADGIAVPEPVGVIPAFQMWLQRKVPGVVVTTLLAAPGGVLLARRVADAAHKLHRAAVPSRRRHTIADELAILDERLAAVALMHPAWATRLAHIQAACERLAATLPAGRPTGIHRDLYGDHVIVDGSALYLLDFDLYCEGDPALDIGNFLGHLTEYSLRTLGDPNALTDCEVAMEQRFAELAGEETRAAVRIYALLTLVRHISLSTQFPSRRHLTSSLLDLCEQRLTQRTS